jgi:AraC-like DNA-binding protein
MQVAVPKTLEAVAPHERFDVWTSWNSDAFAPVRHRPFAGRDLWGTVWDADLGPVGIRGVFAGPHILRRSFTDVAVEDPELVWVTVQLRGRSVISRDGRTCVLKPGDMTLQDSSRPFTTLYPEPVDVGVFQIPRRLLRLPAVALTDAAVCVAGANKASELVIPILTHLALMLRTDALPENREDLGEAVIDLVRVVWALPDHSPSLVRTTRPALAVARSQGLGSSDLLAALKASLERSLHDPALTPQSVADQHHISVRYLYRLFEAEGMGVAGWIRSRRLERCRRDLVDPGLQHLLVADVGQRWGFRSAAHFNRVFRGAYGVSPGAYRQHARARQTASR